MKSTLPFHGLTSPQLRAVVRPILADPAYRLRSRPEWAATIRTLWDGATHREQWYAALALARHRLYRAWRDPDALPLYRQLIAPAPGGTSTTTWRLTSYARCSTSIRRSR